MKRQLRSLALVFVVGPLVACGPDRDGNPDPGDQTLDFGTFRQAASGKYCEFLSCALGVAPSSCGETADDKDVARIEALIDAGRITFSESKARTCLSTLNAINTNGCWGPGKTFTLDESALGCLEEVVQGTIANGASCQMTAECVEGFCNANAGQCPGTCEARREAGAECEDAEQCADGLSCNGTCVAPAGENEGCSNRGCQAGLVCSDTSRTCQKPGAPLGQGAECDSKSTCAAGLYCTAGFTGTGTCEPRVAAGGACTQPSFGESPECAARQVCAGASGNAPGTCATPQDKGGPCTPVPPSSFFASSGCFLGLVCEPTTRKCAEPPAVGEDCIENTCDGGAYCDGSTGKCVVAKPDGAACEVDGECQSDKCDFMSSTCVPTEDDSCNP